MKQYLAAGKVVNTHGVGGNIKVESYCDSPAVLASLSTLYIENQENGYTPVKIERASVHKGMVLCKPVGCNSYEDAVRFKNKLLYCNRDDIVLEDSAVFIDDIIGLKVINADSGKIYGTLADVIKNPANDIYEIDTPQGKAYMPVVSEFVVSVAVGDGIYVRPIEGMFDEI